MPRSLVLLAAIVPLVVGCTGDDAVPSADSVDEVDPADVHAVGISNARVESSDHRSLYFEMDTCGSVRPHGLDVQVVEESEAVRVDVEVRDPSPQLCALGRTVQLNQPLGDRALIDMSTGADGSRVPVLVEPPPVELTQAWLEDGGRTLVVPINRCQADVVEQEVSESSHEVALFVRATEGNPALLCAQTVVVHLDQPLGDRMVIDMSTAREVTIRR